MILQLRKLARQAKETSLSVFPSKVCHHVLPGLVHTALVGYPREDTGFQQDMPGKKTPQGFLNSIRVHTGKEYNCQLIS